MRKLPTCGIPFTQYLLPNGECKPVTIERPPEIEEAAKNLIDAGCRFEIEVLRTGEISMTCECDADDLDSPVLAIEICANDQAVLSAVDRLVAAASLVAWQTILKREV